MKGFEELVVWQEGVSLAEAVYVELKDSRDFGLRDQMQRAAVSIPSNIAEGYERHSTKEFVQFMYIAKGSCAELRTQCHIAQNVRVVSSATADDLIERTRKISAMLTRLIQSRERTDSGPR